MSMENVIQFEAVHKSFGNLEVLKGIDMSIQKGQVVTLIGPSGGGKSTMLRCINGLEVPTSGKVLVNGTAELQRGKKLVPGDIFTVNGHDYRITGAS